MAMRFERMGGRRLMFAAAAATLMLSGCGGSSEEAAPGAVAAPAPAPTPGPAPAPGSPPPPPAPSPSPPPAAPPPPPPIATTAPGIPEGLPVTAAIGSAGGSLTSSDGRLTISVPAGALAASTVVGIQPITATAPGAMGAAYRLTPEGQTFAQPVSLTFKYSAAEARASAPDLLRVATQTAQGTWSSPATTHDATQRTLTVATTHFSDWANVSGLLLRPEDSVVRVGKEVSLRVIICGDAPNPANPNAPPLLRECLAPTFMGLEIDVWAVNGIAGGNASVGTVQGLDPVPGARYKAPATVSSQTQVDVSARYFHPRDGGTVTLVAGVTIVDAVRAYGGAFFARTSTPQAEVEFSANLAVFHLSDPAAEARGQTMYGIATGSAAIRARIPDCDWATGTAFLDPNLTSLITTEGGSSPLANTYQLTVQAVPTLTFNCKFGTVSGPFATSVVVGLTATCQAPPLEAERHQIAGSWTCRLAQDATTSANWTLWATR